MLVWKFPFFETCLESPFAIAIPLVVVLGEGVSKYACAGQEGGALYSARQRTAQRLEKSFCRYYCGRGWLEDELQSKGCTSGCRRQSGRVDHVPGSEVLALVELDDLFQRLFLRDVHEIALISLIVPFVHHPADDCIASV